MTKTQVHIVLRNNSANNSGNEFVGVWYNRAQAEEWIKRTAVPREYFIETYEQPEEGMAHEVFLVNLLNCLKKPVRITL